MRSDKRQTLLAGKVVSYVRVYRTSNSLNVFKELFHETEKTKVHLAGHGMVCS